MALYMALCNPSFYSYYCALAKAPEDVAHPDFAVVCRDTRTDITAVCRNRGGQSTRLCAHCTPGLACKVHDTPAYRLIAICFIRESYKIVVAVNSGGDGGRVFLLDCFVMSIYPNYPPRDSATTRASVYLVSRSVFCFFESSTIITPAWGIIFERISDQPAL